MTKFKFVCMVLLFFTLSCAGNSTYVNQDNSPIRMNVACKITPVESDGVMNLAYHVSLSNYAEKSLTLKSVEVIEKSRGKIIASYSGPTLADIMIGPTIPPPASQELIDGTKKLSHPYLCIWMKMKKREVPGSITHRLTFTDPRGGNLVINGAPAKIQKTRPVVISAPVKGSGWLDIETTSLKTHHFRCEATKNNITKNSEKFAVDWIQYDFNGKLFTGQGEKNEDWFCYRKELIAVANGVVTAVYDNVPENKPFSIRKLKWEEMAGNYVIIRIGNRTYACYCHMIPGTIRVSVGQRVKKGEVLGLLGNSGNSDLPHLHFQICDNNSFYNANGLPYVLKSFSQTGYTSLSSDGDFIYNPEPAPSRHRRQLMENYKVLSFP